MAEWIVELGDGNIHIKKMSPLVRCKDCKFYNPHVKECEGFGNWFGLVGEWGDNDYCSRGEWEDEVEE